MNESTINFLQWAILGGLAAGLLYFAGVVLQMHVQDWRRARKQQRLALEWIRRPR